MGTADAIAISGNAVSVIVGIVAGFRWLSRRITHSVTTIVSEQIAPITTQMADIDGRVTYLEGWKEGIGVDLSRWIEGDTDPSPTIRHGKTR